MKHADIIKIPVGTQVVVSDRVDDIHNANTNNSVIAVLSSHDNYQKPYWSGLYWRPINEQFTINGDSTDRTKRYRLTTTRTIKDNDGNDITETLQTLVSGKEILGVYNTDIQNLWDARDAEQKIAEIERERVRAIEEQVAISGRADALAKRESLTATLKSLIRDVDGGINIHIAYDGTRWLDEGKTRGVPKLSGTVSFSLSAVEELIERVYAELDAR